MDVDDVEAACVDATTPSDQAVDVVSVPVVAIELDHGWRFEWYESPNGLQFGVSEVGPGVGVPLTRQHPGILDLSPTEQWRVLAPNDAVPEELAAYEQRRAAVVPPEGESSGGFCAEGAFASAQEHDESDSVSRAGSCGAAWFDSNYCHAQWDFNWCVLNRWNGAWVAYNDVALHDTVVCADIGDVNLRVQLDGVTTFYQTALEGQVRRYYYSNCGSIFCNDPDYRADVLNASDNRFHFASNGIF